MYVYTYKQEFICVCILCDFAPAKRPQVNKLIYIIYNAFSQPFAGVVVCSTSLLFRAYVYSFLRVPSIVRYCGKIYKKIIVAYCVS